MKYFIDKHGKTRTISVMNTERMCETAMYLFSKSLQLYTHNVCDFSKLHSAFNVQYLSEVNPTLGVLHYHYLNSVDSKCKTKIRLKGLNNKNNYVSFSDDNSFIELGPAPVGELIQYTSELLYSYHKTQLTSTLNTDFNLFVQYCRLSGGHLYYSEMSKQHLENAYFTNMRLTFKDKSPTFKDVLDFIKNSYTPGTSTGFSPVYADVTLNNLVEFMESNNVD